MGTKNHKKKLHLTYKKTRLKPGKAPDEKTQLDFVSWYKTTLKKSIKGKCHILFYDPVHQLHNTINGKCWQKKGGNNTIILESNTGRRRITILGAINPVNYQFTSLTLEGMVDKDVTKITLKNIRDTYDDDKEINIIMDNATYNRAYPVQDYAKELNIKIKYLPPYSPNLNLIERVWKFLKSKLKNKYIEKYEDFKLWINNFCKNFNTYKNEIEKLITNRIQIIKEA
ncbi:MAG: IS630 family transposase [Bacteroidales bacterium]|nr:IS630 family transposase [Bacteroidales bacterium]